MKGIRFTLSLMLKALMAFFRSLPTKTSLPKLRGCRRLFMGAYGRIREGDF